MITIEKTVSKDSRIRINNTFARSTIFRIKKDIEAWKSTIVEGSYAIIEPISDPDENDEFLIKLNSLYENKSDIAKVSVEQFFLSVEPDLDREDQIDNLISEQLNTERISVSDVRVCGTIALVGLLLSLSAYLLEMYLPATVKSAFIIISLMCAFIAVIASTVFMFIIHKRKQNTERKMRDFSWAVKEEEREKIIASGVLLAKETANT